MCLWACLAGISLAVSVQLSALDFQPRAESQLAIVSVRLEVFDLSGRRIFSSGLVPGATYKWYLQRDDGRPVANGVYLYVFFTQTADGVHHRSVLGRIAVRR